MADMKKHRGKTLAAVAGVVLFLAAAGGLIYIGSEKKKQKAEHPKQTDYGVFIGCEPEDMEYMKRYKTIVLEGQSFSREQIAELKAEGHTVYSYINVGALETYRPYYDRFSSLCLDVYENWEDERWVDVSDPAWQDFVINELSQELIDKGVDGLFVDNVDVYYHYKRDEVFDGLTRILTSFEERGMYTLINGGDVYITTYLERYGSLDGVIDGVNQETVFSKILWDGDRFSRQEGEERAYFQEYLADVKGHGKDVYLLEYTTDAELVDEIDAYCRQKGYGYYVSKTLNLEK